jgi:hypothetical protein
MPYFPDRFLMDTTLNMTKGLRTVVLCKVKSKILYTNALVTGVLDTNVQIVSDCSASC